MKFWNAVALVALTAVTVATGCSSSSKKEEELEPVELAPIKAEVGMRLLWRKSVAAGPGSTYNRLELAREGDKLFAASIDGSVKAMQTDNGKKLWEVDVEGEISGGVGIAGESVVVGTTDGRLIALSMQDGSKQWQSKVSSEIVSTPAANSEIVVAHCIDGKVHAVSLQDGKPAWTFDGNMPVLTLRGASPAVFASGYVFVGLANGKLVGLDEQTGQVRWEGRVAIGQGKSEIERIVDIDAPPYISDDTIYVVSYQGRIMAFDMRSGRPMWSEKESSYQHLAEGFGNIYVSTSDGTITAYSKQDGSIRWDQANLSHRQLSAPSVVSSFIAVADYEGYVHLLSQVDGHLVGRVRTDPDGVRASMLADDNRLFVYGNSGEVWALQLDPDDTYNWILNSKMPGRDEVMLKRGIHGHN
jgi:outer membrane protein assembly factor BamB